MDSTNTNKNNRSRLPFITLISILFFSSSALSIELGGKEISREKFIVFILIGHSNMIGRNNDCDTVTHPRAWNFKIDNDQDTWVPARGPLFYDGEGQKGNITYVGCGPGMPLLKRLVKEFPAYHFGVIEYAWSGARVEQFQRWGNIYRKLVPHLNDIKPDVTFGGILAMLGRMERDKPEGFAEEVREMVEDLRDVVDSPTLPYFQQRERPYDRAAKRIRKEQERVAFIVSHSAIVKTSGPDHHTGHYSGEGEKRWANEVVDILLKRKWFPPESVTEKQLQVRNYHRRSERER